MSRAAAVVRELGFSTAAVVGVRRAVESGRGSESVPVRSALTGTILAVAALTMVATFGASLQRLLDTPSLYGWNWHAVYGNPYTEDVADFVGPALADSEDVAAWASVAFSQVEVDGERTQALAFEVGEGSLTPPLIEGDTPSTKAEIVLGARTLREIDRSVGDEVTVRVGDRTSDMRVVGVGVFPSLGQYDVSGLGEGALVTLDGLRELVPDAPRNLFAARFTRDVEPGSVVPEVSAALPVGVLSAAEPPREVADFGQVDTMPAVLAGLLALLGVATLVHVMTVAVRRRRRETAILKTIGFVQRQVGAMVAWQSTTLAVIGLAIGLPLGVAAGYQLWRSFAGDLGVVPDPVIPFTALVVIAAVTVLVANLVALLPARAAATTPAAVALRLE